MKLSMIQNIAFLRCLEPNTHTDIALKCNFGAVGTLKRKVLSKSQHAFFSANAILPSALRVRESRFNKFELIMLISNTYRNFCLLEKRLQLKINSI